MAQNTKLLISQLLQLVTVCRTFFHFFKPQLFVFLHSLKISISQISIGAGISRRSRVAERGRANFQGRRRGWGCAPCTAGRSGCGPCAADPAAAAAGRGTAAAGRAAACPVAESPAAPSGRRRAPRRRPPPAAPTPTRSTLQRAPCFSKLGYRLM
jgi:hypothetical protein